MNLLEAIQGAGENWFRPVARKESGTAYCKSSLVIGFMCGADYIDRNNTAHITPFISELTGEWEIVTPEQVFAERKS